MKYLIIFSILSLGTAENVIETNVETLNYEITEQLLNQLIPHQYGDR